MKLVCVRVCNSNVVVVLTSRNDLMVTALFQISAAINESQRLSGSYKIRFIFTLKVHNDCLVVNVSNMQKHWYRLYVTLTFVCRLSF